MKPRIEIHDVSPKFQKELEVIFNELKDYNKIIAVVPNWEGKWDIRKYPEFIDLVKKQKGKIYQHGYTHSAKLPLLMKMLGWEYIGWEFNGLNEMECKEKIKKGEKILIEAFGRKPEGFIPPLWIMKGYEKPKDRIMFSYSSNKIVSIIYEGLIFRRKLQKIRENSIITIHPSDSARIKRIINEINKKTASCV